MEMEQLLSDKLLEWLHSNIEVDIDRLLLAASDSYEKLPLSQSQELVSETSSTHETSPAPSKPSHTFVAPKTKEEIRNARVKGVPSKTIEDTKYCVNLWNGWKRFRRQMVQQQ